MWGCFSYDGVGNLYKINNNLTKEKYHSILQRHAIPSGIRLYGKEFMLQQDNDPKHTSKLCSSYLKSKEQKGVLSAMDFPPQFPDLNPIEHLREHLKRERVNHTITSQETLWYALQVCWNNVKPETIHTLVESMQHRVLAVLKAKGGHTKY